MDFTSLFNMQGMMFCILALGWYLRKSGMIDKSGKALLSSLVMNVTLPASIVKSFQMEFSMNILKLTLEVIVISFLIQIFSNLLSRVLYPGWSEESKKVLQYATIVSNAGILGNAIAEGIFGDLGIMYAAVYTIPTRIFMWSVGLTYFTEAPTKKELLKKVVTHPCIIGIFTGMVLLVSQFQLPGFVNQTVRTVAGANTFCAMLLIGCTLAEIPFKEVFTREVYYYTFIRLFLIPVIVLASCRLFHIDQLITAVCVILSACRQRARALFSQSNMEKTTALQRRSLSFRRSSHGSHFRSGARFLRCDAGIFSGRTGEIVPEVHSDKFIHVEPEITFFIWDSGYFHSLQHNRIGVAAST